MKNPDSHIIFYAKNWYKRTDVIEDMKILLGYRSGCSSTHIRQEDIVIVLTHLLKKYECKFSLTDFCCDIFIKYPRMYNEEVINYFKDFIRTCLYHLSELKIKDTKNNKILIELDEPDYTLLPKIDLTTKLFFDILTCNKILIK